MIRVTPRPIPVRLDALAPVGVRGQVHVAKLDRAGRRVPVRVDRSKRAWQRVWDHVQGNLITNGGLDYGMGGGGGLRFQGLTQYVHVGTGNATPTASDSALEAELARTQSTLNMGPLSEVTFPSEGVGQFRRVRTFDYDEANGTLTEFGGGADNSATVLTRALFEDDGVPVPITKTDEELLIITYDLIANVSPTSMSAAGTLLIDGYDTFDISSMAHRAIVGRDLTSTNGGVWSSPSLRIRPVTATSTTYNSTGGTAAPGATNGIEGVEEYVPGSFERVVTVTYGPQPDLVSLAGYELGENPPVAGYAAHFSFRFDSPSSLEKDRDYKLTLSAKISVARA